MNKLSKMKSVIVLATVLLTTSLFTSCSSDDDATTADAPSIVGVWLSTSGSSEEFTNDVSGGVTVETYDDDNFSKITFNADNTYDVNTKSTYEDNGEIVVETYTDQGTYVITDSTLSLTDDELDTYDLEFSLSATQLIIVETDEETTSDNDVIKDVDTTIFTRQ